MELTSPQAAELIDAAESSIRNYVVRGILPARRVGLKRWIRINIEDLRVFAAEYGFVIDEERLRQLQAEQSK